MTRRSPLAYLATILLVGVTCSSARAADAASGPAKDTKVPALKVFDATGEHAGQYIDYAQDRGDKPTVYVFIVAERWGRPMARFLRELDKQVANWDPQAYVVAVWLSHDAAKGKEYLPRAQQSIKLRATALTVFDGDSAGPQPWSIDTGADMTAVVASGGKVAATGGYVSVNETLASEVFQALQKTKP